MALQVEWVAIFLFSPESFVSRLSLEKDEATTIEI